MTEENAEIPTELNGSKLLIDLGPLVVFLIAYWLGGSVFMATGIFMVAIAASMIWSKIKFGSISPMLMFSGVMVLIFGSLTLWLHDESFIKIKPTMYYGFIASIMFFGILTKRRTLQAVMGTAYPDLDAHGWHLLTRNFAWFFVAMAVANELVWRNSSTGFWLGYKLWGAFPATLLFGALHVPMILRRSTTEPKPD